MKSYRGAKKKGLKYYSSFNLGFMGTFKPYCTRCAYAIPEGVKITREKITFVNNEFKEMKRVEMIEKERN